MYRIREVDACNADVAAIIRRFNAQTADFPELSDDELSGGFWWLAWLEDEPVAFAGMTPSLQWRSVGYFKRAGVTKKHRGNGLQRRLMRVRINKARKLSYSHIISESTDTVYSANNFIKLGFKLYEPRHPWAFKNSMYWILTL